MEQSGMADDNSRDSGVSSASDADIYPSDTSHALHCTGIKSESNLRRSASSQLDDDIDALKITESTEELSGCDSDGAVIALRTKTAVLEVKECARRTPLNDLKNLDSRCVASPFESPKSRRDVSAWRRLLRPGGLTSALFGRKKSVEATAQIPSTSMTAETEPKTRGADVSIETNSTLEITLDDELNVSTCDASSVFSECSNADEIQMAPCAGRVYWRPLPDEKNLSMRRTQSEYNANNERKEDAQMAAAFDDWLLGEGGDGNAGDTAFGAASDASCRKRLPERPLWDTADTKKLKPTQGDGRRSVKLSRVQSSSIFEKGPHGKVREDELPVFLEVEYSLETVCKPQIDSSAFKSISPETLYGLLMKFDEFQLRFVLVDCRYPYEYDGGHIKGAINMPDPGMIADIFYPSDAAKFAEVRLKVPIFYCEFSQKRGPMMAYALRAFDRKRNEGRYPMVDYKEMYIVDNGYRLFYEIARLKGLCEPDGYVSMMDSGHVHELRSFSLHRSKSVCSLDYTVAKRSRLPPRPRRERYAQVTRSIMTLDTITSSPQEEESPTQFPGQTINKRTGAGDSVLPSLLGPLPKLNF